MKKTFSVLIISLFFIARTASADEGMWLPIFLGEGTEAEMQRLGMRISAKDIYNVNEASLKDAIVLFAGGCTAGVISKQGLIITNHHCGYSAIQAHSTMESNYLINGFWAKSLKEELVNPNLRVTRIVRMEDVTARVLEGVPENLSDFAKSETIINNVAAIGKEAIKGTHYSAEVKPFYYGNQFILIVSEVFSDVRLVGAPPNSIGNFGGDTDNWMWPRHTGDFALFRVYADTDNKPASYSPDNVPYNPLKSLSISLKGVEEGDFTFVFGFPGTTQQYITSWGVDMQVNHENPASIQLREARMQIMDKYMMADKKTYLQYASKYKGVSNFWKKMIGESGGIRRLDGVNKKRETEAFFVKWSNSDTQLNKQFGGLLDEFEKVYKTALPVNVAARYVIEAGLAVEIVRFANHFTRLSDSSKISGLPEARISAITESLKKSAEGFFKNYHAELDKEVMTALFGIWYKKADPVWLPPSIKNAGDAGKGDFSSFAGNLYAKSVFASKEKLMAFLNSYSAKKVKKLDADPALALARDIINFYRQHILPGLLTSDAEIERLQTIYMRAQMKLQHEKNFYPDANSTLRITYGTVSGFKPRDGVTYDYFTTIDGIMLKEDTAIYDYRVDDKLKAFHRNRDFGRYADKDGNLRTCFIATNHTSGGNSGSPVLNADGHLVGINFDRVWEGTMSDLMFDPDYCRNISVDLRYCLFIIDKFAGASHLIEEMEIVP